MKYYCKQCDPEAKTVYSESFVKKDNADGRPGNVCKYCNIEYSDAGEAPRKSQETPRFQLVGPGWPSKDIKKQRQAITAMKEYVNTRRYGDKE